MSVLSAICNIARLSEIELFDAKRTASITISATERQAILLKAYYHHESL